MEMDHKSMCIEGMFSPDSPNRSDIFGDPKMLPRVGNEHQVQILPMITEYECLHLVKSPLLLPIPVMWIDDNVNNHKNGEGFKNNPDCSVKPNGLLGSKNREKSQLNSNKKAFKVRVESSDVGLENGEELKSPRAEAAEGYWAQEYRSKSCSLVPGLLDDSWSDIKVDTFVLGLYIFSNGKNYQDGKNCKKNHKNLVEVKRFMESTKMGRFMESTKMGEILYFYYGKFYRSGGHRKWSNCRKMSKKCILGERIFRGWRQQELLSRLRPHVSEEEQKFMVEVSKTFAEGVTSLEEYVSTLKATAGISMLIKAVGIGKGKEDLTSLAMDLLKPNQVSPVVSEILTEKTCPSLTFEDIMKFLTGDSRSSKTQSNNVFWEAVWPRLLARGWHREKTKNLGCSDSKKSLFLMPGVDMISRRKHVKGVDYFDSYFDVLSKVAADPKLLELEAEEPGAISCKPEATLDLDDPSDHQRPCYCKPQISTSSTKVVNSLDEPDCIGMSMMVEERTNSPYHAKDVFDDTSSDQIMQINGSEAAKEMMESHENQDTNASNKQQSKRTIKHQSSQRVKPRHANVTVPLVESVKFTVVDTSLAHGGRSSKVRELRSLPTDYKYPSNLSSLPRETEGDKSMMVQERTNSPYHAKNIFDDSSSDQRMQINGSEAAKGMMESHKNLDTNTPNEQQSKRTLKHQSSQRVKPHRAKISIPLGKRQKVTACSKTKTSQGVENFMMGSELKQVEPNCVLDSSDACKNVISDVDLSLKKVLSSSSLAEATAEEESTRIIHGESYGTKMSPEKLEKPQLFNLNLPPFSSDSEDGEFLMLEENPDANISSFSSQTNQPVKENSDANISRFFCETSQPVKDSKGSGTSVNGNGAKEQPVENMRQQSTRNRSSTTRAVEAISSGFPSTKKWIKGTASQMHKNPRSRPSNRSHISVIETSNAVSTNTGIDESNEENDVDRD